MWLTDLERLRPALDAWNDGGQTSRDAYDRENHCRCGALIGFAPMHRDRRTCVACKVEAVA